MRFSIILECCVACCNHSGDDALSILHAQTPDIADRFTRTTDFWKTAFTPLLLLPKRVSDGNSGFMLGCVAEEDIPAGTVLAVGQGFWWPKCASPRTNRMLHQSPYSPETLTAWGITPGPVGAENMLYYINTSSPMSMVNDYRNLAENPNAALVRLFLTMF